MSNESLPGVSVVLATYNGAQYLPSFLESIRQQSWPELELVASDDASHDDTLAICRSAGPRQTNVLANSERAGVLGNFSRAIAAAKYDYLAFADQDDLWLPDKLSELMRAMRAAEARHSSATPVLAFCDLELMSDAGATLTASFFGSSLKSSRCKRPVDFLISNHIPGCAMLVNRALVQRAMPIPEELKLHDWWFALVAAALGEIVYVDKPLVRYRQHQSNAVGAPMKRDLRRTLSRVLSHPYKSLSNNWLSLSLHAQRARLALDHLVRRYEPQLAPDDYATLRPFLARGQRVRRLNALVGARTGESIPRSVAVGLLL